MASHYSRIKAHSGDAFVAKMDWVFFAIFYIQNQVIWPIVKQHIFVRYKSLRIRESCSLQEIYMPQKLNFSIMYMFVYFNIHLKLKPCKRAKIKHSWNLIFVRFCCFTVSNWVDLRLLMCIFVSLYMKLNV